MRRGVGEVRRSVSDARRPVETRSMGCERSPRDPGGPCGRCGRWDMGAGEFVRPLHRGDRRLAVVGAEFQRSDPARGLPMLDLRGRRRLVGGPRRIAS